MLITETGMSGDVGAGKLVFNDVIYGVLEVDKDNKRTFKGETVHALGRNGTMKQVGLAIEWHEKVIVIKPINSKLLVGRCRISIPIQYLNEVIKSLKKFNANTEN